LISVDEIFLLLGYDRNKGIVSQFTHSLRKSGAIQLNRRDGQNFRRYALLSLITIRRPLIPERSNLKSGVNPIVEKNSYESPVKTSFPLSECFPGSPSSLGQSLEG
jgi:hypothetical protein